MTSDNGFTDHRAQSLRERAENALRERLRTGAADTNMEAHRLIHELQVHEIELSMQCEELRASRSEVEQERARYSELFDFAPTGYLTLSRAGLVTEANLKAASMLGTNRSALLRNSFAPYVAATHRQAFADCTESAYSGGPRAHCELALAGTYSNPRYVHFEGEADESGTELRVSLVDITDRRVAEADLLLRDQAMRAVSHGIVITNPHVPDNPIVYVNAAFEQMSGYSAAEVIGRSFSFIHGPDTDPAAARMLHEAVRSGSACEVEILSYTRDQKPYWTHLSVTPVRDSEGRLVQFVGVQEDISERLQMARELQQAQRMEAIGRLAGGIAHDFNNLLTVINGYSDVLQAELPASDPLQEAATQIGEAGARAASLTSQLLAFSRRQVMTIQVVDLNVLVGELSAMLRRLIGEDIDLRIDPESLPAYVSADSAQFGQVLMNLVLNARDAMPDGGTLAIRTACVHIDEAYRSAHNDVGDLYHASHREMRTGPYVVVTVSDTGIGMTAAVTARLFEPFFTTKGAGKGTGLGLSLVYGVVKQLDGYITVDSEVDRGTEFSIYLPAAAHVAVAALDAVTPPADRSIKNETILLVEDEASVRVLAGRMLREHGYHVIEAGSATHALHLSLAHTGHIDLLVSDVVMPDMGGRALADALQQTRPGIRVLFMSGYPEDEVLRRGIQQNRTSFVGKPFTQDELARKVRQALDVRLSPRDAS